MRIKARILILLGMSLWISGCAGTHLNRLSADQIVLQVDTPDTIKQKLGKPYQQGSVTKNGELISWMNYTRGRPSLSAGFGGTIPNRTQAFFFFENLLIGHYYNSTYSDQDNTEFDTAKIALIKKGETKIEVAVKILGTPSGEYLYPLIENKDERAKVYMHLTVSNAFKLKITNKFLVLSYDKNNVVTKVDYQEIS